MIGFSELQWHWLNHIQIMCTSLLTDNHTSILSFIFYWSSAFPDAQSMVSAQSTEGNLLFELVNFICLYVLPSVL